MTSNPCGRFVSAIVVLCAFLAGCPITQPQDTPVSQRQMVEPVSRRDYWLYVPSNYTDERTWPLVITLHGTPGWDSSSAQIREWKALAEQEEFIVAAPNLKSAQGILPVIGDHWRENLRQDEQVILGVLDDITRNYRVDTDTVLLTGFSAGGYSMYYAGLRNPRRFGMVIARACNSSLALFEQIEPTEDARKLPIIVFWGKDDLRPIIDQSWQAYRWLRENKFFKTERNELDGGHLRRPEVAYRLWKPMLKPKPEGASR